jgi:hypothetical protein
MQQVIKDSGRGHCRLIYFHSEICEHCSWEDVRSVQTIARQKRQYANHYIQIYNLDTEAFPKGLVLRRIPELIEFCNGRTRYFGEIFSLKNLERFLG